MSHLTMLSTTFRFPSLLQQAAEACGWTWHEGGEVRYYRGPGGAVDYRIEFSDPTLQTYNIGLRQQPDGTYQVCIDNSIHGPIRSDGSLAGKTPALLNQLTREYAKAVVLAYARSRGQQVQAVPTQQANTLRLRLSR